MLRSDFINGSKESIHPFTLLENEIFNIIDILIGHLVSSIVNGY